MGAHQSHLRGYTGSSGNWGQEQFYAIGGTIYSGTNSRGGTDFGFNNIGVNSLATNLDDAVVATGDALSGDFGVYGIQMSPWGEAAALGTNTHIARTSLRTNNVDFLEKYTYGDVEVFGCPPTTATIGNLIWLEDDNDGDPATGTVTYPPAGTIVTATATDGTAYTGTTDAAGIYTIDVPPNDTYTVTVATPEGTYPTLGSDDNSVPDTTSEDNTSHNGAGTTVTVTTEDNLTVDFGFQKLPAIGNLVWIEDDNDGNPATGTVTYPPVGTVVTATAASDGTTYTGTTDASGNYLIGVLPNDTYNVTVATPEGTQPTLGSDDNSVPDTTSEDNTSHDGAGTTVTVTTEDNLTVDFGFQKLPAIGNLVWLEDDGDGDPATGTVTYPPAGTVVTATAASDGTTYTGTTDASGNYLIGVPPNDTYTVTVATPAGSYAPTLGSDDNSVPDTTSEDNKSHDGTGTTVTITTEDNLTVDFGFTLVVDLELTKTVNPTQAVRGDTVVYTITLSNNSSIRANTIEVTDHLPDEVTYVSHTATDGTYDNSNGVWSVTRVRPGRSATLEITVKVN